MSILVPFLAAALLGTFGLFLALAFARAVLYANVLTQLDGAHELRARLRPRRRARRTAEGRGEQNRPALEESGSRPPSLAARDAGLTASAWTS